MAPSADRVHGGTDGEMCRGGRQRHGRRAFGLAAIVLVLWAEPLLAQGVRSIGSVSELVGRCLVSRHGDL